MAEAPPTAVFDLDGTLVDTAEDITNTVNAIGTPEGLPALTLAEGRRLVGGGARATIERAFAAHRRRLREPELDRLMGAFLVHYADHLVDNSRSFPGVEAALADLARGGWRLAVCTNKTEALARRLLDLLGLGRWFVVVAGQDTFGFRKPDPRILLETVRRAGGSPERAVMIGDSETDVATARAAGVPVVAVTFGYPARPATELGADAVIGDFADLLRVLAALDVAEEHAVAPGAAGMSTG